MKNKKLKNGRRIDKTQKEDKITMKKKTRGMRIVMKNLMMKKHQRLNQRVLIPTTKHIIIMREKLARKHRITRTKDMRTISEKKQK